MNICLAYFSFVAPPAFLLINSAAMNRALAKVALVTMAVRAHKDSPAMHHIILKIALVLVPAPILVRPDTMLFSRAPLPIVESAVGARELSIAVREIGLRKH